MTQQRDGLEKPADDLIIPPGTTLAQNFEVGEVVGQGGMAVVYRGIQKSLSRPVALKVLHPRFSRDPQFIERFEAEAGALASLSHPHIVHIIDRGSEGDRYFFVMELVEGMTLDQMIIDSTLTRSDWKRVVAACRDALDYVHRRGVVHRDIKPSNILIHHEGAVKIGDFGIAHIVHGDETLKAESSRNSPRAVGTANYMAPEQTTNPSGVDARADVYSLAVTFYKMFVRALPVGDYPEPSTVNPDVPASVDPVLNKAMSHNREERHASVAEFCDELLKALKDQGTSITSVLGSRKAGSTASSLYTGDDFKAKAAPSTDSRFKIPERTPKPLKQPKPAKAGTTPSSYSTSDLLKNLTPTPARDSTSSGLGMTPPPAVVTPAPVKEKTKHPVSEKAKSPAKDKKSTTAMGASSQGGKPSGGGGGKGGMVLIAIVAVVIVGAAIAGVALMKGGDQRPAPANPLPAMEPGGQMRISDERERLLEEISRERLEELNREVDILRGRIPQEEAEMTATESITENQESPESQTLPGIPSVPQP